MINYFTFRPLFIVFCFCMGGVVSAGAQDANRVLIHQVDSILKVIKDPDSQLSRPEVLEKFEILKDMTHKASGSQTETYARIRFEEGKFLSKIGDYLKAEAAYQEAIDIQKSENSRDDRMYIDGLNRLALNREIMGNYPGAAVCVQEVLNKRKTELNIYDPKIIGSTTTLARLYRKMGDYIQAEACLSQFQTSVINHKDILDKGYAELLLELADLYSEIEDFERAEPTFIEALSYFQKKTDKEHPAYLKVITGMAELYLKMGQKDAALVYFNKVKSKVDRNELMRPGAMLMGLARLSRANEEYDDAEELYLDGLEYLENDFKQISPEYAQLKYELASLYNEQGNTSKAKATYGDALDRWQVLEGDRVPGYPQTLMGLGVILMEEGKYKDAIVKFTESKHLWEQTLGKHYPLYLINILDLAHAYWKDKQYGHADSLYAEVAELGRLRLSSAAHYMTAQELNKYMQKIFDAQAEILSFVLDSPVNKLSSRACYDNALFYKGLPSE